MSEETMVVDHIGRVVWINNYGKVLLALGFKRWEELVDCIARATLYEKIFCFRT